MDDFYLNVIKAFNVSGVRYMVIGGFAVNFYGYNRSTGDLDLWVSNDESNLIKLGDAFYKMGYDFSEEAKNELIKNNIVSFSEGNYTVELLTRINISKEISFNEALEKAETRIIEETEIKVISFQDLKNEKSRSKRYKDLDDLSKLEEAEAYYAKKLKEE
ncbi:nucleotidyltransferase [Roseivirga seohaensis]|uniref:nucleotidyltransferase n=1 Tax=Roseivirga seohaensis TaxID=1914963 RepID=UPI00069CC24C|nr:nucleotidyltransferase [Roseivirga seohaensis]